MGYKKFTPAPKCAICGRIFPKPAAHKYNICFRCKQEQDRKNAKVRKKPKSDK